MNHSSVSEEQKRNSELFAVDSANEIVMFSFILTILSKISDKTLKFHQKMKARPLINDLKNFVVV